MTQCSERVSSDGWHYYHRAYCLPECERKAVVERDGKPYCKIHDPEYKKQKDAKREAQYRVNSCKQCSYHFPYDFYLYCPICSTKRS